MAQRREAKRIPPKTPTTRLYEGILHLHTEDEIKRFLTDLLSPSELDDVNKRFHIASLLKEGLSQREVADKVRRTWRKASTTTVTKTKQILDGPRSTGGVDLVLERLQRRPKIQP